MYIGCTVVDLTSQDRWRSRVPANSGGERRFAVRPLYETCRSGDLPAVNAVGYVATSAAWTPPAASRISTTLAGEKRLVSSASVKFRSSSISTR